MIDSGTLSKIALVGIAAIIIIVFFSALRIINIYKKKRCFRSKGVKGLIFLTILFLIFGGMEYCLYRIPDILVYGVPWAMIDEMGPTGFISTVIILAALIFALFLFSALLFFSPKSDKSLIGFNCD